MIILFFLIFADSTEIQVPKSNYQVNEYAISQMQKNIAFAGQKLLSARNSFMLGTLCQIVGGIWIAQELQRTEPNYAPAIVFNAVGFICQLTAWWQIGVAGDILQQNISIDKE